MPTILQNEKIKTAIQQIAVRSEHQDTKTVLDSFYDCNIINYFKNVNHQIIQGRRGTGKTHILHVLQNELESEKVHCIFFDCKATGSAGEIVNEQLPLGYRSIQLMRDFLFNLLEKLIERFEDVQYIHPNRKDIDLLLDHLHQECFSYEEIGKEYQRSMNEETKVSYADEDSLKALFPSSLSFNLFSRREKERGTGLTRKVSGTTYRNVVFPNIYKCIDDLSKITKTHFVLLIDEWSNLPLPLQPHFAEFIRCCFMPSSHITVKIAAVEARTNYFIKKDNIVYGLEIGADISVAMDLDRLYMFDRNPEKIVANLYRILWKHLKAKNVLTDDIDATNLMRMLFKDMRAAILLARASEGNPRDFISIVNHCINEMDVIGEHGGLITESIVFHAANSWYNLDKYKALNPKQKKLLSEISLFVVQKHGNRGFIIEEDYLYSSLMSSLIDARVLHVLQTERRFPNWKGPMAIVVLDFGTYSQELLTNQSIHFLVNDYCERQIFGQVEEFPYGPRTYPLDKERRFCPCFLD